MYVHARSHSTTVQWYVCDQITPKAAAELKARVRERGEHGTDGDARKVSMDKYCTSFHEVVLILLHLLLITVPIL